MIDIILEYFGEVILVRVKDKDITFGSKTGRDVLMASIEGIKLSKEGAIKEHPDLKDREDWREESIKRFKDKINSFNTENEIIDYIVEDLKKWGYVPLYKQKQGFRKEVLK